MEGTACSSLNGSNLITNTSSTETGTYVDVQCIPGYQISSLRNTDGLIPNVFQCTDTVWLPSTPHCVSVAAYSAPAGVVLGCSVGALLCIAFMVIAAYMLCKSRDEESLIEKEENQLHEAKNMHIDYFISSFQHDAFDLTSAAVNAAFDYDLNVAPSEDFEVNVVDDLYSSQLQRSYSSSFHGSMDSINSITSAGDLQEANVCNV